ncbi:hypothetical protein [Sphingobium yanoikuyae]|jgi:hypothetical protein|uniref:hypothetical protein n=1 Tax=Sphingobium yanoikuyae TaxID=13690 RepID=UPI0035C81F7F
METMIEERWKLYKNSLSDAKISAIQNVTRSAIAQWRKSHSLKSNVPKISNGRQLAPMRHLLTELGWGKRAIAKSQNVSTTVIKDWRQRHSVKPRPGTRAMTERQRHDQIHSLQKRVVKAVGYGLPFDIAADAAAELMLAVIEGNVPINAIEEQGRRFGNQALQKYANAFTTKSLDNDLPGHDGLTLLDTLVDESSSIWLEQMGATIH